MGLVTLNGPKGKNLRSMTELVTNASEQVLPFLEEAKHVLEREHGVGLAAPQIGVPYAWYIDALGKVYINPEIIDNDDDEVSVFEGCLSVPERWYKTNRFPKVTMKFLDIDLNTEVLEFSGVSAWVAQHECDHLAGTLICDHGERMYKGEEK